MRFGPGSTFKPNIVGPTSKIWVRSVTDDLRRTDQVRREQIDNFQLTVPEWWRASFYPCTRRGDRVRAHYIITTIRRNLCARGRNRIGRVTIDLIAPQSVRTRRRRAVIIYDRNWSGLTNVRTTISTVCSVLYIRVYICIYIYLFFFREIKAIRNRRRRAWNFLYRVLL